MVAASWAWQISGRRQSLRAKVVDVSLKFSLSQRENTREEIRWVSKPASRPPVMKHSESKMKGKGDRNVRPHSRGLPWGPLAGLSHLLSPWQEQEPSIAQSAAGGSFCASAAAAAWLKVVLLECLKAFLGLFDLLLRTLSRYSEAHPKAQVSLGTLWYCNKPGRLHLACHGARKTSTLPSWLRHTCCNLFWGGF